MENVMTLEGLDDLAQGVGIKQTAAENPLLTQFLAASILIMTATLVGRAQDRKRALSPPLV